MSNAVKEFVKKAKATGFMAIPYWTRHSRAYLSLGRTALTNPSIASGNVRFRPKRTCGWAGSLPLMTHSGHDWPANSLPASQFHRAWEGVLGLQPRRAPSWCSHSAGRPFTRRSRNWTGCEAEPRQSISSLPSNNMSKRDSASVTPLARTVSASSRRSARSSSSSLSRSSGAEPAVIPSHRPCKALSTISTSRGSRSP
jgi:hypothetical protein